jgi:hypothetical protein
MIEISISTIFKWESSFVCRPITQASVRFSLLPMTCNEYSTNNLKIKIYNYTRQRQHVGWENHPSTEGFLGQTATLLNGTSHNTVPNLASIKKRKKLHLISPAPNNSSSPSLLTTSPPNVSRAKLYVHHKAVTESVWSNPKGTLPRV